MNNWETYLIPALYFIVSAGIGIFLEKYVLKKLSRPVLKSKWKIDDVLLSSMRGMALMWSVIIGLYLALRNSNRGIQNSLLAQKVLYALVALFIAVVISRILVGFIRFKAKSAGLYPSTSIVTNIVRISVYVIFGLVVLQMLGIPVTPVLTPVLTALGVGALAVALALQDTLTNLFSGIQVVASRQVRLGDYVKLDTGEEGYVADITWRNTIIRALANNYIIVPNSKVASAIVTNYYLPEKEIAVLVEVGVAYDSDLRRVEEVTVETGKQVMQNVTGGIPAFEPFIRYHTLGDSSVRFSVILRGMEFTDQYLIKHEFIKAILEAYSEYNIEIPYPTRTILFKEGELK
jgi:small-conductance mechanosensitive channel